MASNNIDRQAAKKIKGMLTNEGGKPLSEFDDSEIEKQIQATHYQNDSEVDFEPIFLTTITDELDELNATILYANCRRTITPPKELDESSLVQKLTTIQSQLTSQLEIIDIYTEEEKRYQVLKSLFEKVHEDNMKILKALINLKDDEIPALRPCLVSIEQVLLKKTVLLLISDLDIVEEEFFSLKQSYLERKKRSDLDQYEIVWIPAIDWPKSSNEAIQANQEKFEQVQAMMPWYIVADPRSLDPVVIRYIKEAWQLISKKQMLVVLDSKGVVVSNNALHMFRIWGNAAFPFSAAREKSLWIEESWKLELLVKTIDQTTVLDWNSQGKVICLYGGMDMEWIRKVTDEAKVLAQTAGISMEMVYVGNRIAKERVEKIISTITAEKLSQCLSDSAGIRCFWTRLESMSCSRSQYGKTVEKDKILQEVSTILSFGESYQGWAIFSKGSDMVTANGDTILTILQDLIKCSEKTKTIGFVPAIINGIVSQRKDHHCNKHTFPWAAVDIPEKLVCGCLKENYCLYRCCTD